MICVLTEENMEELEIEIRNKTILNLQIYKQHDEYVARYSVTGKAIEVRQKEFSKLLNLFLQFKSYNLTNNLKDFSLQFSIEGGITYNATYNKDSGNISYDEKMNKLEDCLNLALSLSRDLELDMITMGNVYRNSPVSGRLKKARFPLVIKDLIEELKKNA